MKIENHRLVQDSGAAYPYVKSPNIGGTLDPQYLVMHYTAGQNTQGAIQWLTNDESRASAHLVIGRDGIITQLVPFDRIAWHAGPSQWQGRVGLNRYAIGIELDNAGKMKRQGGKWRAWFGKAYPDREVFEAAHKHGGETFGWHIFSERQIESALQVGHLLMSHYNLLDVVGHDDISPGRKVDPGPAFPMESLRAKLVGRRDEQFEVAETATMVPEAGEGEKKVPAGARVEALDERDDEVLVEVKEGVSNKLMGKKGWVKRVWLKRIE